MPQARDGIRHGHPLLASAPRLASGSSPLPPEGRRLGSDANSQSRRSRCSRLFLLGGWRSSAEAPLALVPGDSYVAEAIARSAGRSIVEAIVRGRARPERLVSGPMETRPLGGMTPDLPAVLARAWRPRSVVSGHDRG
jgi:hypothetical protein